MTEECLDIHTNYHQDFKEGRSPMERKCPWEGEKQKCTNLYEVIQKEKIKYIDEQGKEYPNLKSFRNNKTNDKQPVGENKRKREI